MKCPNCNYENPRSAKYCSKCDAPLYDSMGMWVYKDRRGIISKPCTAEELSDKFDAGIINKRTRIRQEGSRVWMEFQESSLYEPFASSSHTNWTLVALIGLCILIIIGIIFALNTDHTATAADRYTTYTTTMEKAEVSLREHGWTLYKDKAYDFQTIPIPVYDKGYIVKVDGKYGIIGLDGKYIVKPTYEEVNVDGAIKNGTVFYEELANPESAVTLEYLLGYTSENNPSSITRTPTVTINSSRNVTIPEDVSRDDFDYPITIALDDTWYEMFNGQKYYIWNAKNDRVFGPYDTSDVAMFAMVSSVSDTQLPVPGLFYVEHDGMYRIYTNQGADKTSQVFEYALPISDSYMLVRNGEQIGTMDKQLRVNFLGSVESASAPIMGYDYVKIEGRWYRVYNEAFKDEVPMDVYEQTTETTETTSSDQSEETENQEPEKVGEEYSLNYNLNVRSEPGGSQVRVEMAGTIVNIVETTEVNGMTYGKLADGNWICIFDGSKTYASALNQSEADAASQAMESVPAANISDVLDIYLY